MAAAFTVVSDTQLNAVAPAGTGVVDVTVETQGGSITSAGAYAYVSIPVLTALSPSGGPLSGGVAAGGTVSAHDGPPESA